MKRGRFSEEQIIGLLKEAEAGAKVGELCRRHGISDATFYTWRNKYGGLEMSEMRRLRQLERVPNSSRRMASWSRSARAEIKRSQAMRVDRARHNAMPGSQRQLHSRS